MRYSVLLNNRGPATTSTSISATAVAVDRLGYDTVWLSDHVVIPEHTEAEYPYGSLGGWNPDQRQTFYEPFTTLAYIAGATRGVRLGTSVLVAPQREPVTLGKMWATLDALSGGRVVVGIGVGWLREEFEAVGAGRLFAHRGSATDECIAIWKNLWTERTSTFAGRFYTVGPVRSFPKPVQQPHPPIIIGGNTLPALRRVARLGDGWHAAGLTVAEMRAKVAELRTLTAEAGRRFEELQISVRVVLRLGEVARNAADLAGTPQEVQTQIAALEEAGVHEVTLDFSAARPWPHDIEAMERFASAVGLPARG